MADHVCPWWLGYYLASPLRRFIHKPEIILAPYLEPGMTVLDVGCGMGFFSLPAARMVGPEGRVVCIDLQEKMLNSLRRRAHRRGLLARLDIRQCHPDVLGIEDLVGSVDFALLFAVVHEITDTAGLMAQVHQALKGGGTVLLAEPAAHVRREEYRRTVGIAEDTGLVVFDRPLIKRARAVTLRKKP